MRTIRLYGKLAKFLGQRKFLAKVSTAAEAVRFLVVNFPQLEEHMADQHYTVKVGKREVGEEELHEPSSQMEDVQVIPVIAGAGATGRIIAGVALIALTVFTGGFGGAAVAGIALSKIAISVGASLVFGGVAELLTPTPVIPTGADSQDDARKSYSFSGIQNTSRQGLPVPIVYGETLVGSIVISAGIDIAQVVA